MLCILITDYTKKRTDYFLDTRLFWGPHKKGYTGIETHPQTFLNALYRTSISAIERRLVDIVTPLSLDADCTLE